MRGGRSPPAAGGGKVYSDVPDRWRVDCERLWLAVAPQKRLENFVDLPLCGDEVAEWYSKTYALQESRDVAIAAMEEDVARHPGREWRRGRGEQAAKASGFPEGQTMYPEHEEKPKKSRRKITTSELRDGELYPHPGHVGSEWPGVSASHCTFGIQPVIVRGGCRASDQHYWVPLARRVDLDRVFNALSESTSFPEVRATGSGGRLYKDQS